MSFEILNALNLCNIVFLTDPAYPGLFLQTPLSLIWWFIDWATDPFPHSLLNFITPKRLKLGIWNFERRFTSPNTSCVICHMSLVIDIFFYFFLLIFFRHRGEGSRWRACYQWGLPRLVYDWKHHFQPLESVNESKLCLLSSPWLCPSLLNI